MFAIHDGQVGDDFEIRIHSVMRITIIINTIRIHIHTGGGQKKVAPRTIRFLLKNISLN